MHAGPRPFSDVHMCAAAPSAHGPVFTRPSVQAPLPFLGCAYNMEAEPQGIATGVNLVEINQRKK